ncbi:MAG: DUF502 domain-containing protein [Pseudomonadota bacterium]
MAKETRDPSKPLIKPIRTTTLASRLRTNFLTGIVVIAPIGITLYLTWTVVTYVDGQIVPLLPDRWNPEKYLEFTLPGLGLLVAVLFAITVGSVAKNFFGREIIRIGERWVDRMPVVRSLYNALKQIAETIFTQSTNSFEKACLVEYPRRGIWAIAFVSTETKGEIPGKATNGDKMVSVFLPTTPNPTSGFLLFVPRKDVVFLDMTVEEAAKLVISAGLVTPPTAEERARMQEEGSDPNGPDGPSGGTDPKEPRSPAKAGEDAARNPLAADI